MVYSPEQDTMVIVDVLHMGCHSHNSIGIGQVYGVCIGVRLPRHYRRITTGPNVDSYTIVEA